MYDQKKNNEKTKEEVLENSIAGALTACATYAIGNAVELDPELKGTLAVAASAGIMGVLKTLIRKFRNWLKHRNRKEDK